MRQGQGQGEDREREREPENGFRRGGLAKWGLRESGRRKAEVIDLLSRKQVRRTKSKTYPKTRKDRRNERGGERNSEAREGGGTQRDRANRRRRCPQPVRPAAHPASSGSPPGYGGSEVLGRQRGGRACGSGMLAQGSRAARTEVPRRALGAQRRVTSQAWGRLHRGTPRLGGTQSEEWPFWT
jgi:hypothetical protein